jgi:hypothetical protein
VLPVRNSALKGSTLASLISGGGGTVGIIEIFHTGVTPAEALVSVVFVAGATILLGAANAVRRALEAGLELKLQRLFGMQDAQVIARLRTRIAVNTGAQDSNIDTPAAATSSRKKSTRYHHLRYSVLF